MPIEHALFVVDDKARGLGERITGGVIKVYKQAAVNAFYVQVLRAAALTRKLIHTARRAFTGKAAHLSVIAELFYQPVCGALGRRNFAHRREYLVYRELPLGVLLQKRQKRSLLLCLITRSHSSSNSRNFLIFVC